MDNSELYAVNDRHAVPARDDKSGNLWRVDSNRMVLKERLPRSLRSLAMTGLFPPRNQGRGAGVAMTGRRGEVYGG